MFSTTHGNTVLAHTLCLFTSSITKSQKRLAGTRRMIITAHKRRPRKGASVSPTVNTIELNEPKSIYTPSQLLKKSIFEEKIIKE